MTGLRDTILEVRDVTISYSGRDSTVHHVIDKVNFCLGRGEVVILSGASGSGKTTLALAIIGLLPPNARIEAGSIRYRGMDLAGQSEAAWRRIRGAEIGFVFQEPASALNPVLRAGEQIVEALRAHARCSSSEYHEAARALLRDVRLPDSDQFFRSYPHELSGGQRQRVVIAQALASRPSLLIADEALAAVDYRTQQALLDLIHDLKLSRGLSVLAISHAPAMFARLADRNMVLNGGRLLDNGVELFRARHMA